MDSESSELLQVVRSVPFACHSVYDTTLLDVLTPDELDAAYNRANRFLLDKKEELQKYGWRIQMSEVLR
ncbi:hypothetical protein A0H81_02604 [Grifola frondosa]|uniref:Uncharacterized protein n=1 Tax=Grifola frondosa TaxID=5627 RepID=A0A1C7MMR2_GRIFR|nr:hypothetical protein A0H81_02604 [Grifola frondosa]